MYYTVSGKINDYATELEDIFKSAGIWVQTYYKTANSWLICKLNRGNKVMKINCNPNQWGWYIGDAWTSGSTITNELPISYFANSLRPDRTNIWITSDYVVVHTSQNQCVIIGKLSNGYQMIGGLSSSSGGTAPFYDMTNLKANNFFVDVFQRNLMDKDGNYFSTPLILKDNTGLLINSPMVNIDLLSRDYEYYYYNAIWGNDVIIPIRYISSSFYPNSLILKNAMI